MPPPVSQPRVCAGVDWLTVTARRENVDTPLLEYGRRLVSEEESAGERRSPARAMGYHGWRAGGAQYGVRSDSILLRISGALAAKEWRAAVALGTRTTRLDLQVTVYSPRAHRDHAAQLYQQVAKSPRRRGRPLASMLVQRRPAGQTFYLGSRHSELFGRVYDKGVESKLAPPGTMWRYELEVKGDTASRAVARLCGERHEASAICSNVLSWFAERGAIPLVRFCRTPVPGVLPSRRSNRELAWLSAQVRPTVQRLTRAGRLTEVLTALGIMGEDRATVHGSAATFTSSEVPLCRRAISIN